MPQPNLTGRKPSDTGDKHCALEKVSWKVGGHISTCSQGLSRVFKKKGGRDELGHTSSEVHTAGTAEMPSY